MKSAFLLSYARFYNYSCKNNKKCEIISIFAEDNKKN